MKYNVYTINPEGKYASCYRGLSLVAAENADEANRIVAEKIKEDTKKR